MRFTYTKLHVERFGSIFALVDVFGGVSGGVVGGGGFDEVEFVEAHLIGAMGFVEAANEDGVVTRILEVCGQVDFVGVEVPAGLVMGQAHDTRAVGIPAREQPGSTGAALGSGAERVGEAHAIRCQLIQVRAVNRRLVVAAKVFAKIMTDEDDDVGLGQRELLVEG